jgi:hypothetical protein
LVRIVDVVLEDSPPWRAGDPGLSEVVQVRKDESDGELRVGQDAVDLDVREAPERPALEQPAQFIGAMVGSVAQHVHPPAARSLCVATARQVPRLCPRNPAHSGHPRRSRRAPSTAYAGAHHGHAPGRSEW